MSSLPEDILFQLSKIFEKAKVEERDEWVILVRMLLAQQQRSGEPPVQTGGIPRESIIRETITQVINNPYTDPGLVGRVDDLYRAIAMVSKSINSLHAESSFKAQTVSPLRFSGVASRKPRLWIDRAYHRTLIGVPARIGSDAFGYAVPFNVSLSTPFWNFLTRHTQTRSYGDPTDLQLVFPGRSTLPSTAVDPAYEPIGGACGAIQTQRELLPARLNVRVRAVFIAGTPGPQDTIYSLFSTGAVHYFSEVLGLFNVNTVYSLQDLDPLLCYLNPVSIDDSRGPELDNFTHDPVKEGIAVNSKTSVINGILLGAQILMSLLEMIPILGEFIGILGSIPMELIDLGVIDVNFTESTTMRETIRLSKMEHQLTTMPTYEFSQEADGDVVMLSRVRISRNAYQEEITNTWEADPFPGWFRGTTDPSFYRGSGLFNGTIIAQTAPVHVSFVQTLRGNYNPIPQRILSQPSVPLTGAFSGLFNRTIRYEGAATTIASGFVDWDESALKTKINSGMLPGERLGYEYDFAMRSTVVYTKNVTDLAPNQQNLPLNSVYQPMIILFDDHIVFARNSAGLIWVDPSNFENPGA